MKNNLNKKVVIITGASKGIGRECTRLFLKKGAKVVMVSRNKNELEEALKKINQNNGENLLIEADISNPESAELIVSSTLEKYGTIDILVNNAAQFGSFKLQEISLEDFDRIMNTNIRAVVQLTKLVSQTMIRNSSGTIINVSSTAGKRGYIGGLAYACSKFALNGFSECIAKELRQFNIRVITITPSSVDIRELPESELSESGKGILMRMEDVAESILLAVNLPHRTMVKDIELWGTNP